MSESVMRTVTGRCVSVDERSGWTSFMVEAGGETLRLSTKREETIAAARAVGAKVADWTFKEQDSSTINERTGQPYVNRYLEGVDAGPVDATAGGSQPQPAHRPVSQGDKDRSITRMAVLKAACDLFQGSGDVEAVFDAATRMETWVYRDIDPVPFDG